MSTADGRAIDAPFRKISEPLNIHFEDISCVVTRRKMPEFWKFERKQILKNLNGDFISSKLTGIIGPSGSGKSTLMDVISGYRLKDISGYIYLNGRERSVEVIRRSSYIMQDSILEPLVTVQEAMLFVANIKLNVEVKRKDAETLVSRILQNFELDEHRHTLTKNLSGGQRKKLSIALELVSNPPVLFLDEPTSVLLFGRLSPIKSNNYVNYNFLWKSGLDSKSAKQCVQILRDLASEGRTVICTIHQPSMSILDLFDNVYMLTDGECIYQGTVPNIIPYLKVYGLECPIYHNPIEFVMELCVLNPEEANIRQLVAAIGNGKSQEWFDRAACWSIVPLNTLNTRNMQSQYFNTEEKGHYATSFSHQFQCLLRRNILIELRDPFLLRTRILTHFIAGFTFGLLFYNIGNDGSKMMVIMNVLFFAVMFTMYNALTSRIITFPQNLNTVRREYFNRWYSVKAFYISSLLADIPVQVFSVMIFLLPMYYLSGMPRDGHRLMKVMLIINLLPLVFQDYGILVGTLLNVQNGLIFGMFTTAPYVMFCGLFLYPRDTPMMFRWLYDTSVLRHAIEAIMTSVFGYDRKPLDCEEIICYFRYPQDFLKLVDIENNRYTFNLLFILIFGLVVKFLCYIALKYRLTRGMWPSIHFRKSSAFFKTR